MGGTLFLILNKLFLLSLAVFGGVKPFLLDGKDANSFGDAFTWGVSSSAYQIEGAWDEDGKGESIWDRFTHDGKVSNGATGDTACDSYHKYQEDVQHIKEIGATHYQFSVAWSRVLPDGTLSSKNTKGVQYYRNLVDELEKNGIKPFVTLHHLDLPQALEDYGGWKNETTVNHFVDFARLMFTEIGLKVDKWITIYEPATIAFVGYGLGVYAPGRKEVGTAPYIVGHNLIKAHVKAYNMYQNEFKAKQNGTLGMAFNAHWMNPKTQSTDDVMATARAQEFVLGWFAEPLFGNGDYPDAMKQYVGIRSLAQGLNNSRLPEFTTAGKIENNGSCDFFALSSLETYTVAYQDNSNNVSTQSMLLDQDVSYSLGQLSPTTDINKLLKYIKDKYNNPVIYVTDNGKSDCGTLYDNDRIQYMKGYLGTLLQSVKNDRPRLAGYFAGYFMDSFQWTTGYSKRYGLYHVDMGDRQRERLQKASARYYSNVILHNGLGWNYPPHFIPEVLREKDQFLRGKFPQDFRWAVATAAYQIEGGWDADGKGPSIWDTFAHKGMLNGRSTGDVACDSYHKYKIDIQMIRNLGVSHYRFSIAWSRVLPDGTPKSLNAPGIQYYNNLINGLLDIGVKPMVTLYHWDLPQALQDLGGWENETMIDYFNDYARVCYENFGDRVPMWITFNEAFVVSWLGYGIGVFAPGIYNPGGVYKVSHNIIRSHVKAYHTYNDHFKTRYHGQVGITLDSDWKEPATSHAMDRYAAERAMQFKLGWFANPIFGNGDYPAVMKQVVAKKSMAEGRNLSRLPEFTEAEKVMNKGSADFFGLNHYTSQYVVHNIDNRQNNYEGDQDLHTKVDDCWPSTEASWLKVNPWGMRSLLRWIRDRYNNPPLYVTENGRPDPANPSLVDDERIEFYRGYINEVLKAVKLDNCNVKGYTAWSLMDNLEWRDGYTKKFGLYAVNFTDPDRPRIPKKSVGWFKQLVKDNGFP